MSLKCYQSLICFSTQCSPYSRRRHFSDIPIISSNVQLQGVHRIGSFGAFDIDGNMVRSNKISRARSVLDRLRTFRRKKSAKIGLNKSVSLPSDVSCSRNRKPSLIECNNNTQNIPSTPSTSCLNILHTAVANAPVIYPIIMPNAKRTPCKYARKVALQRAPVRAPCRPKVKNIDRVYVKGSASRTPVGSRTLRTPGRSRTPRTPKMPAKLTKYYSCVATKDLWYNKLSQVIIEERSKDNNTTNIQITYYDTINNTDICKTLSISNSMTAKECISLILEHLEVGDYDTAKFQLWVTSPGDESPYPLIGHEFPFAIKMNTSRDLQEYDDDSINDSLSKCVFILRQKRPQHFLGGDIHKKSRKSKKNPMNIQKAFKRSNSKGDVTDGAPTGILFGIMLNKICSPLGGLPRPVLAMLHQLVQKGPFTVGIFRKNANARLVRELKEKLDKGGEKIDFENINIMIIAGLLKDFLRSLPDCLLCSALYKQWLSIPDLKTPQQKITAASNLCTKLSNSNLSMLQHFLCVLYHISRRSSENMMSNTNLGVCVGPSILFTNAQMNPEDSKLVPATVEFLVERCQDIFGARVLTILGEVSETDPTKQDSGAEESDSLHSGQSLHSSGVRRDDSSIDSLEREFMVEGELSPLPRKEKLSLTNLSRDSGLTLSDSQLYTADEEESGSTSSSNSGDKNAQLNRINARFQHYAAPNNPNAIYTAVYRRPDKVVNTYDEADNSYSSPLYENPRECLRLRREISQGHIRNIETGRKYEEETIYSVPHTPYNEFLPNEQPNHFQRHDWSRQKSNLRKLCKTTSAEGSFMRSNSEESLVSKYNPVEYGVSLGAAGNSNVVTKRSQSNTPIKTEQPFYDRNGPLRRSRSAHHIVEGNKLVIHNYAEPAESNTHQVRPNGKWRRSHSNPQIHDEGDRSYDSSTLSDDDTTPHVSRSNSGVKELGTVTLHSFDTYDVANDSKISFRSDLSSSLCTVVSAESSSTISSTNPPSYEETLNRRAHHKKPYFGSIHERAIREEKIKSAKAKQLYEESLRIYREENTYPSDLVHASPVHTMDSDDPDKPPPLPPKSDIPPLPPKQRLSKRSSDGIKLKHLPPVHLEPTSPKKSTSTSPRKSSIPPSYTLNIPLHKTIIYTNESPPSLPPKEKTIIEVNPTYCLTPERRTVKNILNNTGSVEMKSIETQTDSLPSSDTSDDPHSYSRHNVVRVPVPDITEERRSRPRKKRNSSARSRSTPGRDTEDDSHGEEMERSNPIAYQQSKVNGICPELQDEISWSVSQLRAIFGERLNGAKVHPPPYRPPPSAINNMSPYHFQNGDLHRKVKPVAHFNYEEESYV